MNTYEAIHELTAIIKDLDNPDNEETLKYLNSTAKKMRLTVSLIEAVNNTYEAHKRGEDTAEELIEIAQRVNEGLRMITKQVEEFENSLS